MYEWVVFVHVASILAFMLAHGVHMTAMWAMRGEPDPERSMTFFNDLPTATGLRILLALVVVTGATAGFMGSWWGSGWIWASLLLLTIIAVAMWRFGGAFFGIVQEAAEAAIAARNTDPANPGPRSCLRCRATQLAHHRDVRPWAGRRGGDPVADDVQALLST